MQETPIQVLIRKIPWRRDRLPTPVFLGFPGGTDHKEFSCHTGDSDSIPGLGRSHEKGNSYPFQYSCLENSMDRGAWQATVHGVTKSWTWLSHFHFTSLITIKNNPGRRGEGAWALKTVTPKVMSIASDMSLHLTKKMSIENYWANWYFV